METLTIQVKNNKAIKLLEDLEALKLIKVLKKNVVSKQKLSKKYAGKLSSDTAEKLQTYVAESRNEWER